MTTTEAFDEYLAAIRAGDRRRALRVIRTAREAGIDLRVLYLEVFQPALRAVGQLWQENRISVAEEHLATAITQTAMLHLFGEEEVPEGEGPLLIAACPDSERHEVGLRMLCDFLDLDGWRTLFLGASVPVESLLQMIRERRPAAVALSASIPPHLPRLREAIDAIRQEFAGDDRPFIVVGGRPFLDQPQLAATVGADLTALDAAEAAALLNERFA